MEEQRKSVEGKGWKKLKGGELMVKRKNENLQYERRGEGKGRGTDLMGVPAGKQEGRVSEI